MYGSSACHSPRGGLSVRRSALRVKGLAGGSAGHTFMGILPSLEPTPLKVTHSSKGPRVLVVEDDAGLLELIYELLSAEGFVVETASTSQAALKKARTGRCDLLLLDVILPDSDGVILHGKLKNMLPGIEKKTIFMTGFSTETPVIDYLRSLGAAFLQKPFKPADLLDTITRLGERAKAH